MEINAMLDDLKRFEIIAKAFYIARSRAMRKHKVGNIFTLSRKTLSKLDQYFKR